MKNNMSYEEAVERIKGHSATQKAFKHLRRSKIAGMRNLAQKSLQEFKPEINLLLSIIAAHKQSRKLYGVLREVQETLGMSTELRARVDRILND